MKNIIDLLFTVFIFQNSFAQKLNIFREKSENHILIKGTNISLIPPVAFKITDKFKGFQDPADPYSMIMVIEIPGPFEKISAGFKAEDMLTKGMVLKSKKEIAVNNFKGFLVELTQKSGELNYAKHIVIYGDSSSTAIINGVYLADSTQLGDRILESLKTIFVDEAIIKDPRAELSYEIDEKNTDFQFKAVMGNSILFDYKKSAGQLVSYFADASFAKTKITDKKQFCINRLAQYNQKYQFIKAKGITEIELDGIKGFEVYGQSLTNKKEQIFQTICFIDDDYYYIFCGIYKADDPELVNEFKKLNQTFKVR